jgi:hypothetical protein
MTSVIAAPETGSAAKNPPGRDAGGESPSSLRGVPIWVIGRVGGWLCAGQDTRLAINKTRLTRPTRKLHSCPSFPKKTPIIPRTRPSPVGCHLNYRNLPALPGTLLR